MKKLTKKIEIAKARTLKINLGEYQSIDYFCSAKIEVDIDKAEEAGKKLEEFIRKDIVDDVNKTLKNWAKQVSKETKDKILNEEV
jgi:Mn-dependent DtxR family transcriptional regulator